MQESKRCERGQVNATTELWLIDWWIEDGVAQNGPTLKKKHKKIIFYTPPHMSNDRKPPASDQGVVPKCIIYGL